MKAIDTLTVFGTVKIDGRKWAAYSDGAYRHVVASRDLHRRMEDSPDGYTEWIDKCECADDETSIKVARALNLESINSCDGTCASLTVWEDEE